MPPHPISASYCHVIEGGLANVKRLCEVAGSAALVENETWHLEEVNRILTDYLLYSGHDDRWSDSEHDRYWDSIRERYLQSADAQSRWELDTAWVFLAHATGRDEDFLSRLDAEHQAINDAHPEFRDNRYGRSRASIRAEHRAADHPRREAGSPLSLVEHGRNKIVVRGRTFYWRESYPLHDAPLLVVRSPDEQFRMEYPLSIWTHNKFLQQMRDCGIHPPVPELTTRMPGMREAFKITREFVRRLIEWRLDNEARAE